MNKQSAGSNDIYAIYMNDFKWDTYELQDNIPHLINNFEKYLYGVKKCYNKKNYPRFVNIIESIDICKFDEDLQTHSSLNYPTNANSDTPVNWYYEEEYIKQCHDNRKPTEWLVVFGIKNDTKGVGIKCLLDSVNTSGSNGYDIFGIHRTESHCNNYETGTLKQIKANMFSLASAYLHTNREEMTFKNACGAVNDLLYEKVRRHYTVIHNWTRRSKQTKSAQRCK